MRIRSILARHARRTRCFNAKDGFSLVELLILISVMMISAAFMIPNMTTAIRFVRLNQSGTSYANLLQDARIRAIRDDKYYSVISTTGINGGPPMAFVDLAGSGTYAPGDPTMVFAQGVVPAMYASGPGLINLKSQFLPPGTTAQNSVNTTAVGPTFGPRGLPCTPVAAGGYTTCSSLSPTSFITFIQNQHGGAWEAITVTPAGRVRQWSYHGTNWMPLN